MRGLMDRVIVVAGAATGIGAATALRLAEEGAKVVVGDVNLTGAEKTVDEITSSGGTAIAVGYDQGDERSIGELIATARQHFGALHALHANAAAIDAIRKDTDILNTDVDTWHRALHVNLIGYAVAIRAALPHLLDAGGGSIVLTGSNAAAAGTPTQPAYAASKAGINALCRHVASRWGREGVRCNVVSPGLVITESALASMPEEAVTTVGAMTPSSRLGEPADIAGTVAFLLSDDASWVNGQVWSINGGFIFRD